MALRCLLRRVPAPSPSSNLRMLGPVHGVSPPLAASRFMATGSEGEVQCLRKTIMERKENADRIQELIEANSKEAIIRHNKLRKELDAAVKDLRRDAADLARYGRKVRTLVNASGAVMLAISVPLVYLAYEA